jgi:cell division protein FtsN
MLAKMMIQAVVAAILIGGAAAVYAQAGANAPSPAAPAQATGDNGYLNAPTDRVRKHKDGRKHAAGAERHRDGRDHDNGRDDD